MRWLSYILVALALVGVAWRVIAAFKNRDRRISRYELESGKRRDDV